MKLLGRTDTRTVGYLLAAYAVAGPLVGAPGCVALGDTASALASEASATGGTVLLTIHAHPARVRRGRRLTLDGRVSVARVAQAGVVVELQQAPPHGGRFRDIAHTTTGRGGVYRFKGLRPRGGARYRVRPVSVAGPASSAVTVTVEIPLVEFPHSAGVIAAARYISARAGENAFAVYDNEHRVSGVNTRERFHSASVIKSMLLVAYLQTLAAQHRALSPQSTSLMYPMIHSSDNGAASAIDAIVGNSGLERVARQAGMADFQAAAGWWALTEISAADMARFFYLQDELIPRQFDGYARWLLSHIEPSESWGIPTAGRPAGFEVFFKGGWLPLSEGLVNQAARLERGRDTFAMAVLTRGDPSMGYGEETLAGVAARLVYGG